MHVVSCVDLVVRQWVACSVVVVFIFFDVLSILSFRKSFDFFFYFFNYYSSGHDIPLGELQEHELGHMQKDVLQWSSGEVLWWIENNINFNQDEQLAFRVKRIFCEKYFQKKNIKKNSSTISTHGKVGGDISGKLLSSLYREKLYQLLVRADIPRAFAQQMMKTFGNKLNTTCPRNCGEIFRLKDRRGNIFKSYIIFLCVSLCSVCSVADFFFFFWLPLNRAC